MQSLRQLEAHQEEPSQDDSKIIKELYPNPEEMTYEELLALEDKMGYVSKGMPIENINVSL
jgi:hypothetical protein